MFLRRKCLGVLLAALIAFFGATSALAVTPEDYNRNMPQALEAGHLYGQAALVMDADTGEILFEKNSSARMYPASTTKIMTLLLAIESGISLDTQIAIPQQASQVPSDSSLVPVLPGDEMTFRDLLYGMMINSGNDGANAVAVIVAGSLDNFVERMNTRAAELGCKDTHFVNAHGYHDDQHYSTAEDLALITREALRHDIICEIVSATRYTMNVTRSGEHVTINLVTRNSLLVEDQTFYYENCIGVKSGYHSLAGQCFVGAAEQDGVRLISVTLKCAQSNEKWYDTIRLLNYGFTCYTDYTLEQMFGFASDQIATVKISNASQDDPYDGNLDMNIAQISNADYSRMVQTDSESAMENAIADFVSRSQLIITDDLVAPVSEGEILGNFRYVAQTGEEITALLIASRSVEEQPEQFLITDMFPFLNYFQNPLFRALVVVLALLAALLIISAAVRRARRERRRREIYEARRREYIRRQHGQSRRYSGNRRRRNMPPRGSTRVPRRRYDDEDDDLFGGF